VSTATKQRSNLTLNCNSFLPPVAPMLLNTKNARFLASFKTRHLLFGCYSTATSRNRPHNHAPDVQWKWPNDTCNQVCNVSMQI